MFFFLLFSNRNSNKKLFMMSVCGVVETLLNVWKNSQQLWNKSHEGKVFLPHSSFPYIICTCVSITLTPEAQSVTVLGRKDA